MVEDGKQMLLHLKKKKKVYVKLLGFVPFSRYADFFVSGYHCFINLFSSYLLTMFYGGRSDPL